MTTRDNPPDGGRDAHLLDPAVNTVVAIRSHEKAGFRPVAVMRAYERDVGGNGWHDGLLMELIAGQQG
jgi:aminoglycoside 6'-N-acetyltransferase